MASLSIIDTHDFNYQLYADDPQIFPLYFRPISYYLLNILSGKSTKIDLFHFLLLWKLIRKEDREGNFSMPLILKSNGPSLRADKTWTQSQDVSPRFASDQPCNLGPASHLPRLHVPHLYLKARVRQSPRSHQSQQALTRRWSFICSCTHCHYLLKGMEKDSCNFLERATGSNFMSWGLNSQPPWWEHSFLFWLYQMLISLPFPSLQHPE